MSIYFIQFFSTTDQSTGVYILTETRRRKKQKEKKNKCKEKSKKNLNIKNKIIIRRN
jgi:hypothetical protein